MAKKKPEFVCLVVARCENTNDQYWVYAEYGVAEKAAANLVQEWSLTPGIFCPAEDAVIITNYMDQQMYLSVIDYWDKMQQRYSDPECEVAIFENVPFNREIV